MGRYVLVVGCVMRVGVGVFIAALAVILLRLFRSERRRSRKLGDSTVQKPQQTLPETGQS